MVGDMENLLKKILLASKRCEQCHILHYLPTIACVSLKDDIAWYFVCCRLINTRIRWASGAVHCGKMSWGDSEGDSPEGSRVPLPSFTLTPHSFLRLRFVDFFWFGERSYNHDLYRYIISEKPTFLALAKRSSHSSLSSKPGLQSATRYTYASWKITL
jgi:hypothetical protein